MFRRGKYARPRRTLVRLPRSWIIGFLVVVGCAAGWSLHASADSVIRPESELSTSAPHEEPDDGATAGVSAALPPVVPPLPAALSPALPPLPGALPATTPLGNPIDRGEATTPDSTMWIDGRSSGGGATTPDSTMQIGSAPGATPDVAATYTPESSPVPAAPATPAAGSAPSGSPGAASTVTPVSVPARQSADVEGAGEEDVDAAESDDSEESDDAGAPGRPWSSPADPTSSRQPTSTPDPRAPASPAFPSAPWPSTSTGDSPDTPDPASPSAPETGIPPFIGEQLFAPLPGAPSRAVSFSEWETYRSDVSGQNIMLTTDDSNLTVNRDGKINGNTGDTDASGLNITDATDSFIRGSESADEAPYQTAAAALVDLASDAPGGGLGSDPDDDADDEGSDEEESDEAPAAPQVPLPLPVSVPAPVSAPVSAQSPPATGPSGSTKPSGASSATAAAPSPAAAGPPTPTATAPATAPAAAPAAAPSAIPPGVAVAAATSSDDDDGGGDDEGGGEEFDFPYVEWVQSIDRGTGSAVHTDEGTTLAAGADAFVVGADGYDDDDNRAYGENIVLTRDDGNVVLGGTGDVNSQIGDSEQGAVIMDVTRTFVQGGGAY